jgi:hypothetical protein
MLARVNSRAATRALRDQRMRLGPVAPAAAGATAAPVVASNTSPMVCSFELQRVVIVQARMQDLRQPPGVT